MSNKSSTLVLSERQSSNHQSNDNRPAGGILSSISNIVRGLQQDIGKMQKDMGETKQDISYP